MGFIKIATYQRNSKRTAKEQQRDSTGTAKEHKQERMNERMKEYIDCRAEERAMGEEKESHAEKEKGCKRAKVPK